MENNKISYENRKPVASSTIGKKDQNKEPHIPDPDFWNNKKAQELREKEMKMFKTPIDNIMDDLLVKQLKLVELRKSRGDKSEIRALEKEIQAIKDTPEYKNTLT